MKRSDRSVAPLGLLIAIAACGGSTGLDGPNPGRPGITIAAGANVTDTIGAQLPLALRVEIRDANGDVIPHAVVRFTAVDVPVLGGTVSSVLVGRLTSPNYSAFVAESTSADGVAFARVAMGPATGTGGVEILVPQAGLLDTARFTIRPGAAARIILPTIDTAIQVGRSLDLNGRVEDRQGNARQDPITYEVVGTGVTVANGLASAGAPARASIVGRFGQTLTPDTTHLSVVPAATIAGRRNDRLITAALDGTSVAEIPLSLGATDYGLEWDPDGQSLLAILNNGGLYRIQLNGASQLILAPTVIPSGTTAAVGAIVDFAYSRDRQWVFVSGNNCNYNAVLYRLPIANPAAIERLSPDGGVDDCFSLVNHSLSLSPDGSRLVYENQTWNQSGYSVRVLDVSANTATDLVPRGQRPAWSPTGEFIAYWLDKRIWVVRPDGTGSRTVSPPAREYHPGVRWSADGQWILAQFEARGPAFGPTVALIHAATGLEIPLPWTTYTVTLPAWKPPSP